MLHRPGSASTPSSSALPPSFFSDDSDQPRGCAYSSLFRTRCVDGECHEEIKRFRSCPGRPKEVAVVDPKTRQERWVPAADDDEAAFSLQVGLPDVQGLWRDTVKPQMEELANTFQRDPFFGALFKDVFQWPTALLPPVPGQGARPPPLPASSRPTGGRDIEVKGGDKGPEQPPRYQNSALSNHAERRGDDAVLVSPFSDIAQRATDKLGKWFASSTFPFGTGDADQPKARQPSKPSVRPDED